MTIRGTAVLAATLAVLATAILLTTRHAPTTTTVETASSLVPRDLAPTSIELLSDDRTEAFFTRGDTGWSDARIDGFLETLTALPVIAVIDDADQKPTEFGFRPDALRLRLHLAHGSSLELEMGGPNPAGTGTYVRRSQDGTVLLTGGLLRWELEKLRSVTSTTVAP